MFRAFPLLSGLLVALLILSPSAAGKVAAAPIAPADGEVETLLTMPRSHGHDAAEIGSAFAATPGSTDEETAMFDLINTDRATLGLAPLGADVELLQIARIRASAQDPQTPLTHLDADGVMALERLLAEFGVAYTLAAENLARLDVAPAAALSAQEALMQSREHRASILDPAFNRLAVGVATDGSGSVTFAVVFRAVP